MFKYDENQYTCIDMESHAQIVHNYVCIFYLRNNSSFFKGKKKV